MTPHPAELPHSTDRPPVAASIGRLYATAETHRLTYIATILIDILDPSLAESYTSPTIDQSQLERRLGGSAAYFAIGARMFIPSDAIRAIADRGSGGSDLPVEFGEMLDTFGSEMWVWNESESSRMTLARMWNAEDRPRSYEVVVPPSRRTIRSLLETPLFGAEYLHIGPPNSPKDLSVLLGELADGVAGDWKPKIVFEPAPPSCVPGQKNWLERIASGVEVLSPNHEELLQIYSHDDNEMSYREIRATVEALMMHLLHSIGMGREGRGTVVVRSGRLGACVGTKTSGLKWYPPYFENVDEVNCTGAGNAFLGGFVAGLKESGGDPYEAGLYGTIAASFVVEQAGFPVLSSADSGRCERMWNGTDPRRRLEEYELRLRKGEVE